MCVCVCAHTHARTHAVNGAVYNAEQPQSAHVGADGGGGVSPRTGASAKHALVELEVSPNALLVDLDFLYRPVRLEGRQARRLLRALKHNEGGQLPRGARGVDREPLAQLRPLCKVHCGEAQLGGLVPVAETRGGMRGGGA